MIIGYTLSLLSILVAAASQNISFIGQEPFTSYISAGAVKDSHVYRLVTVTNGVTQDPVTYNIESDDPITPNVFKIVSDTIQISINQLSLQSTYTLVIKAMYGDSSIITNVTINVLPTSETAPKFEHDSYSVQVAENGAANEVIIVAQAFSLTVTNAMSYLIVGGNTDGAFMIDGSTGVIITNKPLDRELSSQYTLIISYIDESSSVYANVLVLVIDDNDNTPIFTKSLYTFNVPETEFTDEILGKITASDLDAGNNSVISYSIVGMLTNDFTIQDNGDVIAKIALDYESMSQYTLQVTANDSGVPSRQAITTIMINIINTNDECPVFSNSDSIYTKDLPYDPLSPPMIGVILTVTATDPDNLNEVITYDILSGLDQSVFSFDSSSGNLSLINTDDTVTGEYTLTVTASESNCVSIATVQIAIGNTNKNTPQFTTESCSTELWENPITGTSVIVLYATDGDIGTFGQINYEIVQNVGDSELFTVNPISGNLTTTGTPDQYNREQRSSFSLGITATDGGFFQDFCLLSITLLDANDNSPVFDVDLYETAISDSVDNNYILQVQAEDPDFGNNGVITYSLFPPPTNDCPFDINSVNGIITIVNNSITVYQGICNMIATASDNGSPSLNSTAVVNISTYENINIAIFTENIYYTTIEENHNSQDIILIVNASVSNLPDTNVIYRALKGSEYRTNADMTFNIDTQGAIRVASNSIVDYERLYPGPYSFRILVTATVAGVSSDITSIAVVVINVTDTNDNMPMFGTEASITLNVVEERIKGQIGVIQATDLDIGSNGDIVYSYEYTGNISGQNVFSIHPNGTVELLVSGLDAEDVTMPAVYIFTVFAYNPNDPNSEGSTNLRINIADINDSPPSFDKPSYSISLNESQLVGSTVLKVSATDPDKNDQNKLVYNIVSGNEGATFQVDTNSGNLLLKRALDYETTTEFNIVIEVSDGIHKDEVLITITVLDIDDEPPVFLSNQYTASVVENAAIGTTVLIVQATDEDSEVIVFEVKGQAEGRFNIDSNGVVTVGGIVDREEFLPSAQIFFLIFAYGGSLGTTDVTINVTDVNDYAPKFILSPFFGTAPENTSPGLEGLYVVTVKAIDLDEGQNGTISYSLISGEDNGFRINSSSGIVTAITTFDREVQRYYTLTVQAIDNGIPIQLFSTVEVIVEISDHNDNRPYWPYPYMFARVYEQVQTGKLVITLPVRDPDNGINSTVIFNITGGNLMNKFSLNPITGSITVANSLDYENPMDRIHHIYFSIQDTGSPVLKGEDIGELEIHVLDSNDHQPMFQTNTSIFLLLPEDTPTGSVVLVVMATDEDSGSNSEINYSIIIGNDDELFLISKHTNGSGLLYLQNSLDYETTVSYSLIIRANDEGYPINYNDIEITIVLSDVNDESPVFTQDIYYGTVIENNINSVSVLNILATDPDSDDIDGGNVDRYELVEGGDNDFKLDENNWIVSVANLDREEREEYILTVIAIDDDPNNPLTGTVTIVITIIDTNDNPSINGGTMNIIILAYNGIFPKQQLGIAYFNDPDINDTFTQCSITSGDDHLFDINPNNCSISIISDNLLPDNTFTIIIQGTDGIHDIISTTIDITIINITTIDSSYLLTFSINTIPAQFLQDIYSDIATHLSMATSSSITIFSAQASTDNDYVIISLFAVNDETGNYLSKTELLQSLYQAKDSLPFELYSIPEDDCVTEPCLNLGECQIVTTVMGNGNSIISKQLILYTPIVYNDYQCICLPGTTGTHCEVNYNDCYSNPCQYGGNCTDGYQDYSCDCPTGTSGKDCSINPDECTTMPCHNGAACANGNNSPICSCPTGYYDDLCQYAYFEPSTFCESSPCMNGGTCSPGKDSFTCLCLEDYTGDYCEQSIQFQGGCVNNPCYNGSMCIESMNGYTCQCSPGFTGPLCRFPLNNCELEYCRNGICEVGVYGAYQCICDDGYKGDDCNEVMTSCELNNNPCVNGGICINNDTDYYCVCDREYYGTNCQYYIDPPDLCINNQFCSNNSICTSGQFTFNCFCVNGLGGQYCDIPVSTDPCNNNPCSHGGQCDIVDNTNFTCICPVGFTGPSCVEDINECLPNPCNNDGTCVNGFGSYLCQCMDGFTGRECDIICPLGYRGEQCEIELDKCDSTNPCKNGGSCQTMLGEYICLCPVNYTGIQCETSNDCTINICHNGGTCVNDSDNGHYCNCIDSYTGSHCELTTVSFRGSQVLSSYRAYDPLGFRGHGIIEFEFITRSNDGLLLLVTQFYEGDSHDYLAVEIVNGVLQVSYSLGPNSLAPNEITLK